MQRKQKILFLCTGNSCRSQMAEALCRSLKDDLYEVYSAGIEQHGMNPYAVTVLEELGLDLSSHHSKTLDELGKIEFDQVVTVCTHADRNCPGLIGQPKVTHIGFDDPPRLAREALSEEQVLRVFRRVRNEIRAFILSLPKGLAEV